MSTSNTIYKKEVGGTDANGSHGTLEASHASFLPTCLLPVQGGWVGNTAFYLVAQELALRATKNGFSSNIAHPAT
jgi:hypothetical protein